MHPVILCSLLFLLINCNPTTNNSAKSNYTNLSDTTITYEQAKENIRKVKRDFRKNPDQFTENEIQEFWITSLATDLYLHWQNTPWDFNGTTTSPGQGHIACGYFVTTLLEDMGVKLNRVKLSTCTSMEMMKSLTPQQKIKNMSALTYGQFCDAIKDKGEDIYIIGLDFHTGFVVNDGNDCWFIHSNYIQRKGVTKELITNSKALQASKTRWLVNLTSDKYFIKEWLDN